MSISEFQITTDANKARMLFSRLMECEKSGARYLDSEMEASKVKIDFRPDMKAVLQEAAAFNRETMANFIREAVYERLVRLFNEKIAAEEALQRKAAA